MSRPQHDPDTIEREFADTLVHREFADTLVDRELADAQAPLLPLPREAEQPQPPLDDLSAQLTQLT